jgi:CubicO group peptidase (beta-lactamase class C family)
MIAKKLRRENLTGQALVKVKPEREGFSSERLARINSVVQKYISCAYIPGAVTLVSRHGNIVHLEAQGLKDVKANLPVSEDSIFRICSMTKPITAVAMLMLCEEEQIHLDEPISRFIPAFKNPTVIPLFEPPAEPGWTCPEARAGRLERAMHAVREITIRDCLTHTAGWPGIYALIQPGNPRTALYLSEQGLAPTQPARQSTADSRLVAELVERLARLPLDAQPGTRWEYGPGLEVVGRLIEIISGKSLEEFYQQRIFIPLAMNDTSFKVPNEKLSRVVALYQPDEKNNWRMKRVESPPPRGSAWPPAGGGGLFSTIIDYARFAQMLLNSGILGDIRLLGRKTVELMTTNHTGNLPISLKGPGYGFGLGVSVRTDLGAAAVHGSVGSYGWLGADCTFYLADPKESLLALFFTQLAQWEQNKDMNIIPEFEKLVYQALVD